MPGHDIIVVGASAGGVESLTGLVRHLPADLPATIFVVLHFPAHGTSMLPSILQWAGPLSAAHAQDEDPILPGHIYVAPPNQHLLIKRGAIKLSQGPRENGHRPAIDPLFRTAAHAYGRRVVGMVLSGTLDDGTAGLQAIKLRGGVALVQDPAEALFDGMPVSAIQNVAVDRVLSIPALAAYLAELAHQPLPGGDGPASHQMEEEARMAEFDLASIEGEEHPGSPSGFACPECGGALWEIREGELIRFRCWVGHAFSAETLVARQSDALEAALWPALRAEGEGCALGAARETLARPRT